MKYQKMQQSKFRLPITATDITPEVYFKYDFPSCFYLLVFPNSMFTQFFIRKGYVLSGEIALKNNHYYYIMLAFLMLLAALSNAVCLHALFFFAIDFCKCFLFMLCLRLLTHSLFISSIIFHHEQCF